MMDKGQKFDNPKETGVCEQILFGPKEKVTCGRRKICNEEVHNLYSSANIATIFSRRRARLAGSIIAECKMLV
jgi:hypothetical protein